MGILFFRTENLSCLACYSGFPVLKVHFLFFQMELSKRKWAFQFLLTVKFCSVPWDHTQVSISEYLVCTWEECVFYLLLLSGFLQMSLSDQLVNSVQLYFFPDSLSTCIYYWERDANISNYYCGFVYFSFQFRLLLCVFGSSVVKHVHI